MERLEQHAGSLAAAQTIVAKPIRVLPLSRRLDDNAHVLLAAYRSSSAALEKGLGVVPAAEWLLDNYHIVEEQIREIRDDLPPGYYRQLPKLDTGPFAGYPRVFGLAWGFVAHTDSHFDPGMLQRFVAAYQRVQPLTIGELWAIAITLRIVLVENMRRLAVQIREAHDLRTKADDLADRLLGTGGYPVRPLADVVASLESQPLPDLFAAQLAKRLRDQDPKFIPSRGWLEERLNRQQSSIEDVVRNTQQRQGASNVTIRNIVTSMRLISDTDWPALFESVSLVDAQLRRDSAFGDMDFPTRDLYRNAIEQLARGSGLSELDIADRAIASARAAAETARAPAEADRYRDPGFHLIAGGRPAFEAAIGFRPPMRGRLRRLSVRLGLTGYVGMILVLTSILLIFAIAAVSGAAISGWLLVLLATVGLLPATEAATALVNRAIGGGFDATPLPGLELGDGVPETLKTLVAVPTMLTNESDIREEIERLEIHHLASPGGDVIFALLLDGVDADRETIASDAPLLILANEAIARLNRAYGPAVGGDRFLLLHRRRVFCTSEGRWMGWERKRGKLHELNRLLRGATDTTFDSLGGHQPAMPSGVRYVVTLDADTRLPRDTVRRLIGKMAHPLNRPRFHDSDARIVDGYAILQPRVTPALPIGRDGSLHQRVFSSPGGMDPYAAAVSDVYQDLFGEGSYTGKGIYDVDAFERALEGRIPESTMLSHDLFEGSFARAGLASDVEVVEDFPSRYDVAAKRQHRWARGDWQLLPWIVGRRGSAAGRLTALARWKMLDNLRRTLVAPMTLLALVLGWTLPLHAAVSWTAFVLGAVAVPALLPILFAVIPRRAGITLGSHLRALGADTRLALLHIALDVIFVADHAYRMGDAITRTLFRLFVSRRNLLEWVTAAQTKISPQLDLAGFSRQMSGGVGLGATAGAVAMLVSPASWPVVLPFVLAWCAAPAVALWISRSPKSADQLSFTETDASTLRLTARRTWRFFETFVTTADNMLPPDNFQEDPKPALALRTSPTNLGLHLLSAVAARDLGWAGTIETVERLEASLEAMARLERFRGHFYNWYGTRDMRVLDPAYVSTVDSGNLAGHLITLANACRVWTEHRPADSEILRGLDDDLALARDALLALPGPDHDGRREQLSGALDVIAGAIAVSQPMVSLLNVLKPLCHGAADLAREISREGARDGGADLVFWTEALDKAVAEHARDLLQPEAESRALKRRLRVLESTARDMAFAMEFDFLLDPDRKLLSIGYSVVENRPDANCYDLLASEARLASLFAIAKGDVPTRHWFRLGRTVTPIGMGAALISWSGSMFEYLMPSLVMRAPAGSILEQTNRLIVEAQQRYGRSLGIPWGISESAYNARDREFTYQYSNFGVPGLGLKRGLAQNAVIAPYATGLASMVDPRGAAANYAALAKWGALGRYGFYEALDFTPSRVPDGRGVAIVRNFMAHHQGMTIVAIANTLQGGRMRARFHAEPMIQAAELLLQERAPRDVAMAHPKAGESKVAATGRDSEKTTERRLGLPIETSPETHLLSNGSYAVVLTSAGSGYSRSRDMAITRWREDAVRDDWGSYVFLRDVKNGAVWSAGFQPVGAAPDGYSVVFSEDRAEFVRRDGSLDTTMAVVVSAEVDAEVRRVTLANSGPSGCEIEITSYAEIVLATPASDDAHPAFSKMFVETEYLPEIGAILATRRRRAPTEPTVWAAHFAVVEGEITAEPSFETDRARFLGRGRTIREAVAVRDPLALSNTAGTVLDAIFSIRRRIAVPAGGSARVAFWTIVAPTRQELLDLVDQHHDRNAFERAATLAWTQAQVQLRHLDVKVEEAADFQRLAGRILYADPGLRPSSEGIRRGSGPQSGLWPHGISGDIPIVLVRIDDIEDMGTVRQLLRAHEYWRMKQLQVDLVILNERASSYVQDLQIAIETAVRSNQSRPRFGVEPARGAVFTLRADLLTDEAAALLQSVARVVLVAGPGSLGEQLLRLPTTYGPGGGDTVRAVAPLASIDAIIASPVSPTDAEFFNGLGGFTKDGQEYITFLASGRSTPAPWINVIANEGFGFQVSADGSGYTWSVNSRENQLTAWSNDPVTDASGEAIYLRDEETGDLWSPTAFPIRDNGTFVARHGRGYSRFEHTAHGIETELTQFVPLDDPIKIQRLGIRNRSGRPRRLSVTAYVEWVLGTSRGRSAPFVETEIDPETGAMLARNPWNAGFGPRVAFADLNGGQTAWTADRREFIGRNGSLRDPAGLAKSVVLSGRTGAGLDPCATLQATMTLADGVETEIVLLLGETSSIPDARALIARTRAADLDAVLAEVARHWDDLLGTVQVKTPDRSMDIMLNGWLLYQTLACRITARSAFYQASGAYGFRDQIQDGMALTFARPALTRHHLLRAAARQFVEGDVQHWWIPSSGQGVRTKISDDRVWLAYGVATYIETSGDAAILEEGVPFLEGRAVGEAEHDAFFVPQTADETASLFEHCARGLDQCLALTSEHGLPLIGTGDWNDGMNRVGEHGRGESIWLGWLLIAAIKRFAPMAEARDPNRAARWRAHAASVLAAIEREGWDDEWYRRGTFDDGTPFGTAQGEECKIDSIAQSWAVLSGAADPTRAARAMASLETHLIRRDEGLALLFTPPFDKTPLDPGYIKGYPPGVRENGGQYSHAAMWAIMAYAKLGEGNMAGELFALLNPINHARSVSDVERYKVEPYVVAADVYSVAPHVGRGGWTWYTGSAGWMYRAGIEAILGIRQQGKILAVDPCIPSGWPRFSVSIRRGGNRIEIEVENPDGVQRGIGGARLDGVEIAVAGCVHVPLDGLPHQLVVTLGGALTSKLKEGRHAGSGRP